MRRCLNSPMGTCPTRNLTECIQMGAASPCLLKGGVHGRDIEQLDICAEEGKFRIAAGVGNGAGRAGRVEG